MNFDGIVHLTSLPKQTAECDMGFKRFCVHSQRIAKGLQRGFLFAIE